MKESQLKSLLLDACDRLQLIATTGEISCEETNDFVESVRNMLDAGEDYDAPADFDESDP